jgi:hypothetical protein
VSDRLRELQRQRALVQEHLAWLDREIAVETGINPKVLPVVKPATTAPMSTSASPLSTETASGLVGAERIMAQYRQETDSTRSDVRKGCFLYLAMAFALVGLVVVALYFYSTNKH